MTSNANRFDNADHRRWELELSAAEIALSIPQARYNEIATREPPEPENIADFWADKLEELLRGKT